MNFARPLALIALTTALCGCSAIPNADLKINDYKELRARKGKAMDSNLSIAPVKIAVKGTGQEGYKLSPIVRSEMLQGQLQRWIEGGGLFRKVVTLKAEEGQTVDGQAWAAGTDLIVETTITELNTSFKDHNGWWVPNMVNWFMFMIPAWWVATDEYQVTLKAELRVRLIDQTQPLYQDTIEGTAKGIFNEFDRGWRWFGLGAVFGENFNARENWKRIAERLYPAATSSLAQTIAARIDRDIRPITSAASFQQTSRRTLAICVGVGNYESAKDFPVNPAASAACNAFTKGLSEGIGSRYIVTLRDAEATVDRLERAIESHLSRARTIDKVYLYFAARTKGSGAEGSILLHEARADGSKGQLSLSRLGELLGKLNGQVSVFFESDFAGAKPAPATSRTLFAPLTKQGVNVLSAGLPGASVLVPRIYQYGLFTLHLGQGTSGKADADADGQVSFSELARYVGRHVRSDAGFFKGVKQNPSAELAAAER